MSKSMRAMTVVASAALLALVVHTTMAQPPGGPRGERGFGQGPQRQGQQRQGQQPYQRALEARGDQMKRVAEKLGLTEEQREQLKQIREETREKIQKALRRIHDEAKEKMKSVLTEEQLEQWEQMREKMAERRTQGGPWRRPDGRGGPDRPNRPGRPGGRGGFGGPSGPPPAK